MSERISRLARPVFVAGTLAVVGAVWVFTRAGGGTIEFPRPADAAPIDAAIDAISIDAAPGTIDPNVAWTRHTITQGALNGADGVDLLDINGDGLRDVVSPWEQSSSVTVSLHPGAASVGDVSSWQTVTLPCAVSLAEDARFGDVDGDGAIDVIAGGEGFRLIVAFAPTNPANLLTAAAWTCMTIDAATNLQRWLQVAHADLDGDGTKDIIAGGGVYPASLGYFTSSSRRVSSSWTYHQISPAGYTMSLIPLDVDTDGDLDLVVSDREPQRPPGLPIDISLRGSRWSENTAGDGSTWANHTIKMGGGAMKFAHATLSPKRVIDGFDSTAASSVFVRTTSDWLTWTEAVVPRPSNVGTYQDSEAADIDGDGVDDIVISYSRADDDTENRSGVVWLKGPSYTRGEVSGVPGEKFDNVVAYDVDGDGDLDLVTSEQGEKGAVPVSEQLGVIWYENPRIP